MTTTTTARKPFDAYYHAERDATDAQIDEFVRLWVARQAVSTAYKSIFIHREGALEQEIAAATGIDIDNRGNEQAIMQHPGHVAWAAAVEAEKEAANAERKAARHADWTAKLDALCEQHKSNPAFVRALREKYADLDARGLTEPVTRDFSDWAKRVQRPNNPYGGKTTTTPAYTPEKTGAKLLLKQAVGYSYRQETYADESEYLIPVEMTGEIDEAAMRRNLNWIASLLQTHNGWAGSGSTLSFGLVVEPDGAYVTYHNRASISD
jgi:hypothetical protein